MLDEPREVECDGGGHGKSRVALCPCGRRVGRVEVAEERDREALDGDRGQIA